MMDEVGLVSVPKSTVRDDSIELSSDLANWVDTLLKWEYGRPEHFVSWSFPTNDLAAEYLRAVSSRPRAEVLRIVEHFLIPSTENR